MTIRSDFQRGISATGSYMAAHTAKWLKQMEEELALGEAVLGRDRFWDLRDYIIPGMKESIAFYLQPENVNACMGWLIWYSSMERKN